MLSIPKHQDNTFSESLTSPLILIGENNDTAKQNWDVESPQTKEDTSHIKVVTAALETKIEESRRRLQSGQIGFASASVAGNCGRQGAKHMATSPFIDSFTAELKRISNALKQQSKSTKSTALVLLKEVDGLSHSKNTSPDLSKVKNDASSIHSSALQLNQVANEVITELLSIANKADTKLGTTSALEVDRYLTKDDMSSGTILILLSDIYSLIRSVEESNVKKDDGFWVAPSSFERITTKFWVRDEHLPEVLLKSARELPLLVYGKSGLLHDATNPTNEEDLWGEISSVYFDSPSMDLYKERIKRSEGAKLFRVRWYGDKPSGDDQIFLELKTHHECWINDSSVKERVAIQERHMPTLLDTSTGAWTSEYAHKMVKEASPSDSDESLKEAAALLLEIRGLVCKYQLRPCVRTKYTRCAFQSSSNNNLRLTIDKDITVIDETRVVSGGNWCLADDSIVPLDAVVKIPYCVFEVKVSDGEDPLFIDDLQQSGVIVKATKFSKFLTGAAIHNSQAVNMLPWWADDKYFEPFFSRPSAVSAPQSITSSITSATTDDDDLLLAAEEGSIPSKGLRKRRFWPRKVRKTGDSSDPKIAPRSPARVEPKSFFANERTFIRWVGAAMTLVLISEFMFLTAKDNTSVSTLRSANFLMGVALVIVVYGLAIYYRRLHLMINAKPYGYADAIGPSVFAFFIIVGISLIIYWSNEQFTPHNPTLYQQDGVCVQRHLGGDISMIEFEPSDIIVDEKRGQLLIASLNEIVAIPDGIPRSEEENNVDVKLLYNFPEGGEDLEALEIINDDIFAVSEKSSRSELITLQRQDDDTLMPIMRHSISTPAAEGMAYISTPNWFSNEKPRLVVAGVESNGSDHLGNTLNDLIMDSFQLPLPESSLEDPQSAPSIKINDKIFGGTLKDAKVSAMQYFDGLLYLLFDNAQMIRSFDSNGNIVQEINLPIAVEGFEKQWEGMRLQRKDGELLLHLALDSPPQVWSLQLIEKDGIGHWELPSCAS